MGKKQYTTVENPVVFNLNKSDGDLNWAFRVQTSNTLILEDLLFFNQSIYGTGYM